MMRNSHELLLFVDLDDTVVDSAAGFLRIFAEEGWIDPSNPPEYSENWGQMMGASPELVKARSDYIWQAGLPISFEPVAGAVEALKGLKENGLHGREVSFWGATSRPITSREVTRATIERHFGGIITNCVFAGFYDGPPTEELYAATKESLYRRHSPNGAIDDQSKHANGAVLAGVALSVHFGPTKIETDVACMPLVQHAANWAETRARIDDAFAHLAA